MLSAHQESKQIQMADGLRSMGQIQLYSLPSSQEFSSYF